MNTRLSTNRKFKRMFVNILSIFAILAIAFPVTGSASAQEPAPWRDEFDGPLTDGWYWINENPDKWGLNDGFLRIDASPYGTGDENLLLRPIAEGDFSIETRLIFSPDTNFQFAGLVIWQDEGNFLQFGRAFCDIEGPCVGNGIYFDKILGGYGADSNFATQFDNPFDPAESYLRLERRGDMVRAFYSHEGITWTEIGIHWVPPEFQVNAVGLTSSQDFYTPEWDIPADFDYFEMTEGWGFLPEGWHDGNSGEVDPSACVAFGWSADPDDRDRDVQIRVLSDGEQVAEGFAQDYGEDMEANNICPGGTCRFTFNLWGVISADEAHEITVQAYDVESNDWWNLEDTPKSLTCLTPVPRVYANLPDDGIRFEYSAPGASVNFSIYDSPDGNLLWEGSRAADDSGFVYLGIWDHRVDLEPGIYIVASDDKFTKQLLIEPLSLDDFDPVENILRGTASPNRTVWVVANNESVFCGTNVDAGSDGNWAVDFDDYGCDPTEDMWAYAQAVDAEGDTSEAVPDFIEGYHDYDTGDVPSWACNAGGWVVDSNDRERDLTIRILADGNEVTSSIAGNSREDLFGVCGADGSCGFEVSLWGLISPYEEHQVMVQAYDEETGQWFDLNNTPRTLTCRTYDIYAYDPLTGETKQISNIRDADEYDPTWSPNGKMVAHDVVSGDSHQIHVTDVKTGVSTVLHGTEDGGNDAAWSPNGRWIAFDRRWFGEPNIYIVPATGGDRILAVENAFTASWAPNGKRIAFQSNLDHSIRTAPVDGGQGGETTVADYGETPAWSPDGNWIAYNRYGDIWKVQVNVQGKVLGEPIQLTSNSFNDGKPTWTPDSQTIIYDSNFGQDSDLWSIPAAGGTPTWLTGAVVFGEYGPANARNSTNIAYAGFSPNGQAPRTWVAAFTYDLPAGYWSEGTHTYHFEAAGVDNTPDLSFDAGNYELYDGTTLLRPWSVVARKGEECFLIDKINPDQKTQFYVGWTADGTYSDALTYYENLMAKVAWDAETSVDMLMHEVFPLTAPVDWFGYTCTFTTP